MKYQIVISVSFILLFSFLHSMEEEKGVVLKNSGKDNVPPLYIVTTVPSYDNEEVKEEAVSSSSSEERPELTDSEIAEMLYARLQERFPDNPEIASRVNDIATKFCVEDNEVKNVLRRTRGSPRYNEEEYKKAIAKLELEALKQEIINAQEKNKLAQERLLQEKKIARSTLRLGYCNLAVSAALGLITTGISTATFIALLASGCSE